MGALAGEGVGRAVCSGRHGTVRMQHLVSVFVPATDRERLPSRGDAFATPTTPLERQYPRSNARRGFSTVTARSPVGDLRRGRAAAPTHRPTRARGLWVPVLAGSRGLLAPAVDRRRPLRSWRLRGDVRAAFESPRRPGGWTSAAALTHPPLLFPGPPLVGPPPPTSSVWPPPPPPPPPAQRPARTFGNGGSPPLPSTR